MIVVKKQDLGLEKDRTGRRYLAGEAPTMGLAPGEWPEYISVVDDAREGFLFQRSTPVPGGGGFNYSTPGGLLLTVFSG